jgi:uncharacterized protein YhfF
VEHTAATDGFFAEFQAARAIANGDYDVTSFGNTAAINDELLALVESDIVIKPLASVDEAFAWDEGEGDRTLDWWLAARRWYFGEQAAREGFAMSDQIETVFEGFVVVWPAALADDPRSG